MQITIDSSEPLESVLRVVGALYNVQLSVLGEQAPETPRRGSPSRPASRRPGERLRSRGGGRRPDTGEIREWARTHGYEVSDRGRIPAALLEAYNNSRSAT
jgi:hypothetical protein